MKEVLDRVPNSVVDRNGTPRFGTFQGELPAIALNKLGGEHRPAWWQWGIRRKRWHYTVVVTDEVLVCQAVVDGRYFGQGFIYVVDLFEEKEVASRVFTALPHVQAQVNDRPALGHRSQFRAPGVRFALTRGEGSGCYRWDCRLHPVWQGHRDGLRIDAEIDTDSGGPALTVISPVHDGGIVNITQKWAGLPVEGKLRVGSRSYRLDDGIAGLDYTQGILARRTSWRWALAMGRLSDGRSVALNLVSGFNDGHVASNENALWVGDRLISLDRADFDFDREYPDRPWVVRTRDGVVDLYFDGYYVYRESRQWKIIDSHFVQPAGRFEGTLTIDGKRQGVTLFGVTEDQDVYW